MRSTVGVLALQGDFAEHAAVLESLGARVVEVRLPADLDTLDALIIPGGESTTLSRLLSRWSLREPIVERSRRGMPVWGTCAGAILLAKSCDDPDIEGLRLMEIEVHRNAFGRQVDSFETSLEIDVLGAEPFPGVFIRAPRIVTAGAAASVLASLPDGSAAAVREDNLLATTFHPELTGDKRFHSMFLQMTSGSRPSDPVNASTMR